MNNQCVCLHEILDHDSITRKCTARHVTGHQCDCLIYKNQEQGL